MRYLKSIWVVIGLCMLLAACKKECLHEYQSEITLAVSCTQAGEETFTCVHCEDSYKQTIPALDHTYAPSDIEKEATCSEVGSQKYVCTDCGSVKTQTIEKLAHTLGEAYISKEPNCTDEGEYSATCTVCGESEIVEAIPTNNNHVFINTVIREATCIDPGEGVNTCSLCQYSEPCEYGLTSHSYGAAAIVKKATCTQKGKSTSTCTVCNQIKEETIAAKGHNWSGATCSTAGTCTECGAVGSKASHSYTIVSEENRSEGYASKRIQQCKHCGYEKTLYVVKNQTFDLEAIRRELLNYAKKRGFQISYEIKTGKSRNVVCSVLNPNIPILGSEILISEAKDQIDDAYNHFAPTPAGIGAYTMHVYVTYSQSGSMGQGWFTVDIEVSS